MSQRSVSSRVDSTFVESDQQSVGGIEMDDDHGRFVWYELMTTDMAAAKAFYADVVGWSPQDASTRDFAYTLFVAGAAPACGLMELPMEGRKMGARPRWAGYVAVANADASAARLKHLGGTVYVPPTDSNIGRVAVVADPQTADFALVEGLKLPPSGTGREGGVGWHELSAADWQSALAFYGELFGWQKVEAEAAGATDFYQLVGSGGRTIGGMFSKLRRSSYPPFWQYYFNVADVGVSAKRVKAGGGRILQGPVDMPDGSSIIRCVDPQGAIFALQGARGEQDADVAPATEVGWAAEWGGFASRGRLVAKPKSREDTPAQAKSTPQVGAPAKPKR
jgi:predicted enzyme related to lactoylglutathione lyase